MKKSIISLLTFCMVLVISGCSTTSQPISKDNTTPDIDALLGSWQVTSAQTSLILSIEPDHKVLVLWLQKGGHSMLRTSWKPFHGGILVQGMPRIRLWPGRGHRDNELRAELEAIPEMGYDPNKEFHDHFFMRRIKYEEMPQQWQNRLVPEEWMEETLEEKWNSSAGRKPLARNRKGMAEQMNSPDK